MLLKNVLFNGICSDILIENNRFKQIAKAKTLCDPLTVDCTGLAILPPFYNAHCHAAMTLLRGFADDMPLSKWLSEYIWPKEAKLDDELVYAGSRLAILEMIKSGTVFFSDMYWRRESTMRAANEMGVRASIGVTFAENLVSKDVTEKNFQFLKNHSYESELVHLAVMPHSIYTCGGELLKRCRNVAKEEGYVLHMHLSETKEEYENCMQKYGMSPVMYLNSLHILNENFVAAHMVHIDENDMRIFADSSSTVVHCPVSNLKLSSGIFPMERALSNGMRIALGTDGASSNNNLDMHEEMKFAALLAKTFNPETLPAREALSMATVNGAKAYGLEAGKIEEGFLADALLIDITNERLVPDYNFISNWVYSANAASIKHVICNGKFIMKNGVVPNEESILQDAKEAACRLMHST